MTIRAAGTIDAPAIARLSGELGYPAIAEDMEVRLSRLLLASDDAVLLAELSNDIVGWIHVCVVHSLESEMFAEIRGLVVDEKHRGSGVGSALIKEAEKWGVARSCRRIRVRTNTTRVRTHEFYEKLGYKISKTQKVFDKSL